MTEEITKDSKIIVIGAGTFGLSTALHLASSGYTNIHCFDKYEVPSEFSAGNDINKMLDYTYFSPDEEIGSFDRIILEAVNAWKTNPLFTGFYHPVGFVCASSSEEPLASTAERVEYLKKKKLKDYEFLKEGADFRKQAAVLTGEFPNWRGYVLDKDNGWIHARNSLIAVYEKCKSLGVNFYFGDEGEIQKLNFDNSSISSIVTKSGRVISGDKYSLTLGANAVTLLDFEGQLESKCFTLVHIKVTDDEAKQFKSIPVIFNYERGFFFEPDEHNEIKICNEFPGYTNFSESDVSVPKYANEIPLEAEVSVRSYLKEVIPEYAERPFVKTKICWCTDSPDRELLICTHPTYKNLVIGSGDSGKSFALFPVIGKYIGDVIKQGDASLKEIDRKTWRWRPEISSQRDNRQERWGGKGIVTDLKDIDLWVSVENPEPHKLF